CTRASYGWSLPFDFW
nr:immunoglobulin heavy chain junction region [Macaca mulatta]MOV40587.1 immunoglobulin heavy chain junction region [Macaca mulatta]MOV44778.1 immunoglobulin heavy chain junction region [Macaca mulatta]MOV46805.1 immunoglobulin heavy chain junction region [Macaca mulatta]